jgi:hypothetical protein
MLPRPSSLQFRSRPVQAASKPGRRLRTALSSFIFQYHQPGDSTGPPVSGAPTVSAVIFQGGRMTRILIVNLAISLLFVQSVIVNDARAHRQHKAHRHGVAHVNIVVEGNEIAIELISPAADIVGFEHVPQTPEQKEAVQAAKTQLLAGDALFRLPPNARARLVRSNVETDIDRDSHGHDAGASKGAHRGDKGHAHERHSDFVADYRFVCENPDHLSHIDVMVFAAFPGIEKINLQVMAPGGQTRRELTAKRNRIEF